MDIETNEDSGTKDDPIAVDCLAKYGAGKVKDSGLGFSKADEIAFDCFSECVEAVVDRLADAGGIEKEEVAFVCFSITGATGVVVTEKVEDELGFSKIGATADATEVDAGKIAFDFLCKLGATKAEDEAKSGFAFAKADAIAFDCFSIIVAKVDVGIEAEEKLFDFLSLIVVNEAFSDAEGEADSGIEPEEILFDCISITEATEAEESKFDCFSDCETVVEAVVETEEDIGADAGIEKELVAFDCFSKTGATEIVPGDDKVIGAIIETGVALVDTESVEDELGLSWLSKIGANADDTEAGIEAEETLFDCFSKTEATEVVAGDDVDIGAIIETGVGFVDTERSLSKTGATVDAGIEAEEILLDCLSLVGATETDIDVGIETEEIDFFAKIGATKAEDEANSGLANVKADAIAFDCFSKTGLVKVLNGDDADIGAAETEFCINADIWAAEISENLKIW